MAYTTKPTEEPTEKKRKIPTPSEQTEGKKGLKTVSTVLSA